MPAAKKAAIASPASTKIADETKTEPPAITAEPFAITATVKARQQRSKSKPSIVLYLEDWRNPMAYPPPECKDMAWLAWEFLRRNKKYAEHVNQMRALPPGEFINGLSAEGNACLDGMVCTPAARPGETVDLYLKRVAKKSGGKIKPRIEKPQSTFINRWMLEQPVPVERKYEADEVQFVPGVVKMYRNKGLTGRRVRLMMYFNEMAVRFRLDLPLEIQLSKANLMLKRVAKRFKEEAKKNAEINGHAHGEANAKQRIGKQILDAHFWLRAYDASNEPKKLLDDTDKKRKRALKAGPSEIAKRFKSENIQKNFQRGAVGSYFTSAKEMIDKKGYQMLVIVFDAAPKNPIHSGMRRLAGKLSSSQG